MKAPKTDQTAGTTNSPNRSRKAGASSASPHQSTIPSPRPSPRRRGRVVAILLRGDLLVLVQHGGEVRRDRERHRVLLQVLRSDVDEQLVPHLLVQLRLHVLRVDAG